MCNCPISGTSIDGEAIIGGLISWKKRQLSKRENQEARPQNTLKGEAP